MTQCLEAERSLINTAIASQDNYVVAEAEALGVTEEVFSSELHQNLWSMVSTMHRMGEPITDTELLHRISRNYEGETETAMLEALMDITSAIDPVSRWRDRADDVLEAFKLSQLHRLTLEIRDKVAEKDASQDIATHTEQRIRNITERGYAESSLSDAAQDLLKEMFDPSAGENYVPTGLTDYDKSLKRGGFGPRQLVTIGARPGKGKTTFALNCAAHCAKNLKRHALIFSLEMDTSELLAKLASSHSGMPLRHFEDNVQNAKQAKRFSEAVHEVSKWPLIIKDDAYNLNLILAISRNEARRKDVGVIIVDYCQLIKVSEQRKPREQQIAEISRELKLLAKSLKVPVILLCQLNRESEKEDRAPRMSDLRESGAIEQDSDSITFLYNLQEDEEHPNMIRWIRPKQRAGMAGCEGKLTFIKETGTFMSYHEPIK